ncbi:MAG: pyridoxal phosphate-dependent aminotransferase [Gammaproteobacteria bacterium]|nr:pyridoxal phosphate-dependent aminotransferase [Gammaproteobacteria bacterium]
MKFSTFAAHFNRDSGILRLMEDLGEALDGRGRGSPGGNRAGNANAIQMLGGGNPAAIPAAEAVFRAEMEKMLADGDAFERMVGNYDAPQGNAAFIDALAAHLADSFGWRVTPANIAVTNGSQSAFGILFNLFAGAYPGAGGAFKKILLPVTPEYIGYADVGLGERPIFTANRPRIETGDGGDGDGGDGDGGDGGDGDGDDGGDGDGDGGNPGDAFFKYRVDFDRLESALSGRNTGNNTGRAGTSAGNKNPIGAVCISRPTNPTGNMVTDAELAQLSAMTGAAGIPLIIDGAYGPPFPNIVFTAAKPLWDAHIILCLSLSKLGLPGARTGILVAAPEVIRQITAANAIFSLAPGRFGPSLVTRLLRSGALPRLCADHITPFYRRRGAAAVAQVRAEMADLPVRIHQSEGAIFLWLWFPGLPVSCETLYQRLKRRGVLVIAGQHFFPGLDEAWAHRDECIRVTFAADQSQVERGLSIIAEEARRAYTAGGGRAGV